MVDMWLRPWMAQLPFRRNGSLDSTGKIRYSFLRVLYLYWIGRYVERSRYRGKELLFTGSFPTSDQRIEDLSLYTSFSL